ncbi:hypothetical protein GF327_00975 [Candidatus Woesearchaeota archaeon]|nr:hypothetical protein [Candidatus Woesearchaeota archaeon]
MVLDFLKKIQHPQHELFRPVLKFLKTRKKYVIIAIGAVIFFLKFRNIFILFALGLLIMSLDFFMHSFRSPIHIDLLFFVSILIARVYGFKTVFIFALVAGNLPEILTASFEIPDMLSFFPIIIISFISLFFPDADIAVIGIILSVLFAFSEIIIARLLAEPPHKVYLEPFLMFFVNILLFLNFGNLIISLMSA